MIANITYIYSLLLGWMPVWFQVVTLGLIGSLFVFMILKLVAFVLDCIPFV